MPLTNYYNLLGVPEHADDDTIRKAYFKAARQWHPDKNPDNVEEATEKFKQFAEANEVLRDPQQRAAYDHELRNPRRESQEDTRSGGSGGFWSWFGSGRETAHEYTEEEKEWQEARRRRAERAWAKAEKQQEEDDRKEAEAAERRRVKDEAQKLKVKAYKEEKERQQREDAALQQSLAEDLRRKADADAKAEIEDKKRRQLEKQLSKEARQRLKAAVRGNCIEEDDLQEFCLAQDLVQLETISCELEACRTDQEREPIIVEHVQRWKNAQHVALEAARKARTEAEAEKAAAEDSATASAQREWTVSELSHFTKATVEFPGGYPSRFKAISEHLAHLGFSRGEKACAAKIKELKACPSPAINSWQAAHEEGKPTVVNGDDATVSQEWSAEQQKALEAALVTYPASIAANERWSKIAADVPGRTKKECVARFKWLREQLSKEATAKPTEQAPKKETDKVVDKEAQELERRRKEQEKQKREEKREKRQLELQAEQQELAEKKRIDALERDKYLEQKKLEAERYLEQKQLEQDRLEAERRDQEAEQMKTEALERERRMAAVEAQRRLRTRSVAPEEELQNRQLQEDEAVVLESIFPDCFQQEPWEGPLGCVWKIRLGCCSEGDVAVELQIPAAKYPSLCPPQASFSNLPIGCSEADLNDDLEAFFVEHIGNGIVYEWVTELQQQLQEYDGFELPEPA